MVQSCLQRDIYKECYQAGKGNLGISLRTNSIKSSLSLRYSAMQAPLSLSPSAGSGEPSEVTGCGSKSWRNLSSTSSSANDPLRSHRSRLPTFLYLLSFASIFPDEVANEGKSAWKRGLDLVHHPTMHPRLLYAIGSVAAVVAGLSFPAWGLLFGYWTQGMLDEGGTKHEITSRGEQAGLYMALVGLSSLISTWIFLVCCE